MGVVAAHSVVSDWMNMEHHIAHAVHAFRDSPFESAWVFSLDGGGSDGAVNLFVGGQHLGGITNNLIMESARRGLNFGCG